MGGPQQCPGERRHCKACRLHLLSGGWQALMHTTAGILLRMSAQAACRCLSCILCSCPHKQSAAFCEKFVALPPAARRLWWNLLGKAAERQVGAAMLRWKGMFATCAACLGTSITIVCEPCSRTPAHPNCTSPLLPCHRTLQTCGSSRSGKAPRAARGSSRVQRSRSSVCQSAKSRPGECTEAPAARQGGYSPG